MFFDRYKVDDLIDTEKLMMESWESETYIEYRESVHPLIINLEDTSEEENDSHDWPVPLE
jgi:hypothetical protein